MRFVSPIIVSGLLLGQISSSIPRQTPHPQRGEAESGLAQRSLVGDVRHAFDVNVHAPLRITATILEHNRFSSGESRVVFVTSSLGRPESALSFAGMGLYSVTKAALSRLAMIQAREFELRAPHVRVLRVHPGIVDTDMETRLRRDANLESDVREEDGGTACIPRGDWVGRSPAEHPRTISARFAAEFVLWVARSGRLTSSKYDFYRTEEFHRPRSEG